MHADVDEGGNDRRRHALRFSLAGVQLKFSALNEPRGGLTIPARGIGGSWIVKLPSHEFEGLLYPDRRHAALAPAYDFVATIAYIPDDTAALKFSRTRSFSEFSEDELSHLAARAMLPERLVLDTAREPSRCFTSTGAPKRRTFRCPPM